MLTIQLTIAALAGIFLFTRHRFRPVQAFTQNYSKLSTNLSYPSFLRTIGQFVRGMLLVIAGSFLFIFASLDSPASCSMAPTFNVGDIIYSSKSIYGISLRTLSNIPGLAPFISVGDIYTLSDPQVGDVCVFKVPFSNMPFCKRIVAKGGDEVHLAGPFLTINGFTCPLKFIREEMFFLNGLETPHSIYERELPNGLKHEIAFPVNMDLSRSDCELFFGKVPEGHYMMMGDNFYNSDDSRSYLGMVSKESILSKLQFVIARNPKIRYLHLLSTEFGKIVP